MSWKPSVRVINETKFSFNALCFATEQEAKDSAQDLAMRWFAVEEWKAVESADPVTHSYLDHQLKPVEQAA